MKLGENITNNITYPEDIDMQEFIEEGLYDNIVSRLQFVIQINLADAIHYPLQYLHEECI